MKAYGSFLGKGWSFPPTFEKNSATRIEMVQDEVDIEQSLQILMTTSLGERVMLPEFGCDLFSYLFAPISNTRIFFIKELITAAITNYEHRIELHEVYVDYKDYLNGIIRIGLNYSIIMTNTRFNLVFPYYKAEGTDIPQLYSRPTVKPIDIPDDND